MTSEEEKAVNEVLAGESREALWAAFERVCKTPGQCTQWGMMPVSCNVCKWNRPLIPIANRTDKPK